MEFDELISNGQLTKAARLFAKEYYDSGRMGHTRRLLIERLADKCDKYDAEIARQSVKSEEVQEAIKVINEKIYTHKEFIRQAKNTNMAINILPHHDKIKSLELAITALQQMRTPVEPMLDHWAVCPECGYEYILEIMVDYATSDEWLVKYCPECGQPFKYDDQWKDDDGKTNLKWEKALHGDQWIPVSNVKPEKSGRYLAYVPGRWTDEGHKEGKVIIAYFRELNYEGRMRVWDDGAYGISGEVTHYRPLPEPPKGE